MNLPIYQVDAFASELFTGNPAAVCPLKEWLSDELMQNIAQENNLAETAFFVAESDQYHIRWFTPKAEVDLCGHATLASAHVLFEHLGQGQDRIVFHSKSGTLVVTEREDGLMLDFPADDPEAIEMPEELRHSISSNVIEVLRGKMDYAFVLSDQEAVQQAVPDLGKIAKARSRGVIITASGKEHDLVSRYFAPQFGISEDPVTGSAHTLLTPYWARKLGKNRLSAAQLSERGGELQCQLAGDRVLISGQARTYLIGEIQV